MKLYMLVTADEYELPIAVADTQVELGRMLGVDHKTISKGIERERKGKYTSRYKAVEVDDE